MPSALFQLSLLYCTAFFPPIILFSNPAYSYPVIDATDILLPRESFPELLNVSSCSSHYDTHLRTPFAALSVSFPGAGKGLVWESRRLVWLTVWCLPFHFYSMHPLANYPLFTYLLQPFDKFLKTHRSFFCPSACDGLNTACVLLLGDPVEPSLLLIIFPPSVLDCILLLWAYCFFSLLAFAGHIDVGEIQQTFHSLGVYISLQQAEKILHRWDWKISLLCAHFPDCRVNLFMLVGSWVVSRSKAQNQGSWFQIQF